MRIDFFLIHLLFLRIIRTVKYDRISLGQSLTRTDVYFILLSTFLIHLVQLYVPESILYGLILLNVIMFLYFWLDALLYKLFSVELGVGGIDIVFSNLWHEVMYMQRTSEFLKTNRTFFILPLSIILYNLLFILLKPFDRMLLITIIIIPHLQCTIKAFSIKFHIIEQHGGRALIEDFIYSRHPKIPLGFYPRQEHLHLFRTNKNDRKTSKPSVHLNGSSILLLTFESASTVHFASLNNKKRITATTPFFDRLLNDAGTMMSQNHFCLSPLTTPAHIALYSGCYTFPNDKSAWNICRLAQSGYKTIYLTTANVKLYGLYTVLQAAGFDYILDGSVVGTTDSELLTKGINQLETILDDKMPFFVHIHSANTHIPYLIETKLEQCMRSKTANDLQRFLFAIEQTDYIFERIYLYVKNKVNNNLLTIISSDHGQAFGEHDYWTHGNGVIKEEVNVPLLINHSKLSSMLIPFSTHFDICPTIFNLLGLDHCCGLGHSLLDQNRSSYHCLLWDGKPSRSTSNCLGLIVNEKKYRLDLVRYTCCQSDWNDEQEQELTGDERTYIEALIGTVAQYQKIIPIMNLNQKLLFDTLNRTKHRILVVTPTVWEMDVIHSPYLQSKYEFIIANDELNDFLRPWKKTFYCILKCLQPTIDMYKNRIDGVLGTGDLYGCVFAAYISSELGLPGTTTKSIIMLCHKYYSRQLQKSIVPEAVPEFDVVNPYSIKKPNKLDYPFFIKPVKGTMSILAQMVHNENELKKVCKLSIRHRLQAWTWYRPLNQFFSIYGLTQVSTFNFIAESPLYGQQVTVEGFVRNGLVTVMGIVDSIMYPNTISFQRFEYPSSLKPNIQNQMIDITTRLMSKSTLNHSLFNVEMFYNQSNDQISIIEINPRMSYQFSDLFKLVDGISSFEIQLQLAVGKEHIEWMPGKGNDKFAASFVMRRFTNARVLRIPDQTEINQVINLYPSSNVKITCHTGQWLSDNDQDIGSYRYAIVNMSAQTREKLYQAFEHVQTMLTFEFSSI